MMPAMKVRLVIYAVALAAIAFALHQANLLSVYALQMATLQVKCGMAGFCKHVRDDAGTVPPEDLVKFEHYMHHIERESGVDLRFVFVQGTGAQTLEEMATALVDDLRIGGRTGDDRGLLLLYDVNARRLKVEVGYGLEGIFPDVFVKYLVDRHAKMFLEADDPQANSVGLRLLLRLLQARIREAVLGDEFDPQVLSFLDKGRYLSGGAGVASGLGETAKLQRAKLSPEERARYAAGDTPEATYAVYLHWLNQPVRDGNVDFLERGSRNYISGLPVSAAYGDLILLGEYGKRFAIVERGDLAILYFTSTPFTSPHFFAREDGKWRMDIVTEVRNTREFVGTYYTWAYSGQGDKYTKAFGDLLKPWGTTGFSRFKNGDNRLLQLSAAKR